MRQPDDLHAVHGGGFFEAVGTRFQHLEQRQDVVNADVLDAWYDPSPKVLQKLNEHLPWLVKTSPPTHGEGLVEVVSEVRRIPEDQILLGAGSSALIYMALPQLLPPSPKVVLLDPMYGEYRHFFEHVLPSELSFHELAEEEDFAVEPLALATSAREADLVAIVNPNSPNGAVMPRAAVEQLMELLPVSTLVWIDETYIDFAPGRPSCEDLVSRHPNLIISKSMSKYYSLSGLRAAYLVASPEVLRPLRKLTPPWSVGLLAQVAAVEALLDPAYYETRTLETRLLRGSLGAGLAGLGLHVFPSEANFVLARLPGEGAARLVASLAEEGVHIRDCASISPRFGDSFIRIAVKPSGQIGRILEAMSHTL